MGHRPWTTFVGRERDLERLRALSAEQRVITLVGPGGVGKTRLAREAWSDAVLVELSSAIDTEGVVSAFCRALAIESIGPLPRAIDVLRHALIELPSRRVVLDGCDDARGEIASLLGRLLVGTSLRFLCTSRKALELAGEQRCHVEPLSSSDAERLFCDRARLADPEFVVEPSDRHALERVLAAVGGFPLALELVAAQLPTLGLEGLGRRLASLPLGGALEPLREIVAASTASLPAATRDALLRFSVFAETFSLADAEAQLEGEVAVHLRALVDASLVRSGGTARHRRFALYEPVRAFARAALQEDRALERSARDAHLRRVLGRVAELDDRIVSLESVRDIEQLLPDVRATLRDDDVEVEVRCRLISALEIVIVHRGPLPDLAAWVEEGVRLVRAHGEVAPTLRARVLSLHALVLQRQGFVDESVAYHLEAGWLALESGDCERVGESWLRWLVALVVWGRLAEASDVATALLGQVEGPHVRVVARMYRALASLLAGAAIDDSLAELRRTIIELERRGDRRSALIGQGNLAVFLVYLGRLDQARRAFDDLSVEEADAHTRVSTIVNRALLFHELGFATHEPEERAALLDRADGYYRQGIAAFARVGGQPYAALVRAHHAMLLFERGELAEAERTALTGLHDQPDARTRAFAHAELATMRGARGAHEEARALLLDARALLEGAADASVLHGIELHEELAALRERAAAGVRTREDSTRLRTKLERYATFDVGSFAPRVRAAARLLLRALDDTPSSRPESRPDWLGCLVVGREGSWLRAPCGTQADLSQRPKLRALVSHLLRRHEDARGRPVPASELIAEVWPDERFVAHAGRTRLHTLVFTLRSLGLRDVIQSTSAGYCLDPALSVVRAEF